MKEWCAIFVMGSPFRYFTEYITAFDNILSGSFPSKYILLSKVYAESIEGRELILVKWDRQQMAFQNILPINIDHITSICKIKSNSEFAKKLNELDTTGNIDRTKLKTL